MKHRPNLSRPIPRLALNEAELAVALGVGASSIRAMVEEGLLPRPRVWHRRRLFHVAEVDAALLGWPTDGEESEGGDPAEAGDWKAEA